MKTKMEVTIR